MAWAFATGMIMGWLKALGIDRFYSLEPKACYIDDTRVNHFRTSMMLASSQFRVWRNIVVRLQCCNRHLDGTVQQGHQFAVLS